jgi:hypothetical protein
LPPWANEVEEGVCTVCTHPLASLALISYLQPRKGGKRGREEERERGRRQGRKHRVTDSEGWLEGPRDIHIDGLAHVSSCPSR